MPRATWPLCDGRPVVHLIFHPPIDARPLSRTLLADTGAGRLQSRWHLLLSEEDCYVLKLHEVYPVSLTRAYDGTFPAYLVRVSIPSLITTKVLVAVAVPAADLSPGLDGLAGFRSLNSFGYGNFDAPTQFGLQTS